MYYCFQAPYTVRYIFEHFKYRDRRVLPPSVFYVPCWCSDKCCSWSQYRNDEVMPLSSQYPSRGRIKRLQPNGADHESAFLEVRTFPIFFWIFYWCCRVWNIFRWGDRTHNHCPDKLHREVSCFSLLFFYFQEQFTIPGKQLENSFAFVGLRRFLF